MNFKIPQNVDVEDKILPFLSVRQLIILIIWWTLAWILFNAMIRSWVPSAVWGPIVSFISIWSILIAFVRIHYLDFHRWIVLFFAMIFVPRKRIWDNQYLWWLYLDAYTWYRESWKSKWKKQEETKTETFSEILERIWEKKKIEDKDVVYEADDSDREDFARLNM